MLVFAAANVGIFFEIKKENREIIPKDWTIRRQVGLPQCDSPTYYDNRKLI